MSKTLSETEGKTPRVEMKVRADADRQSGATPTVPMKLLMLAETHPATGVPWLSNWLTGPPVDDASVVKSAPGIWLISGSSILMKTRLNRAVDMIRSVDESVRKPILEKLKSSKFGSVKNSATFALSKL